MNTTLPSDHPYNYVLMMHACIVFTLPTFVFTFYCVMYKSPKQMSRFYKRMLLVFVVNTGFGDICMTSLITPVALIPSLGGYPTGLFSIIFDVNTVYFVVLQLWCISSSATSMMQCFHYRVNNILPKGSILKLSHAQFFALYVVGYSFVSIVVCGGYAYMAVVLSDGKKSEIAKVYPELKEALLYHRTVTIDVTLPSFQLYVDLALTGLSAGLIVLVIAVRYTLYILDKCCDQTSAKTNRLRKHFLVAHCLQSLSHVSFFAIPVMVSIFQVKNGYLNRELTNSCVFVFGIHGTVSLVVMLFVYKSYRTFVLQLLTKGRFILFGNKQIGVYDQSKRRATKSIAMITSID